MARARSRVAPQFPIHTGDGYEELTGSATTTYGGGAGLIVYAVVPDLQRVIILRLVYSARHCGRVSSGFRFRPGLWLRAAPCRSRSPPDATPARAPGPCGPLALPASLSRANPVPVSHAPRGPRTPGDTS